MGIQVPATMNVDDLNSQGVATVVQQVKPGLLTRTGVVVQATAANPRDVGGDRSAIGVRTGLRTR